MFYLWKTVGETPLACLNRFRDAFPVYRMTPLSYAGRLDPMAEGLLLIIEGEENKVREQFLGRDKRYEATIVFGVATDTYDILGMPSPSEGTSLSQEAIKEGLVAIQQEKSQKYPPYSSKKVFGKLLWQHMRDGTDTEIARPTRPITIYDITLHTYTEIPTKELITSIQTRVEQVQGDFRQKTISAAWHGVGREYPERLWSIATISCTVSSGTYIRGLAHTLGEICGTSATLLALKRTWIGAYK